MRYMPNLRRDTFDRAQYMLRLAYVERLRVAYVLPAIDPDLRAHNRLAMRQALQWARVWRTVAILPA